MNDTDRIEQRIAEIVAEAERNSAQSEHRLTEAKWELDKARIKRDTTPQDDRLQRSVIKWEQKIKELEAEVATDRQTLTKLTQTTTQQGETQ